MTVPHMLLSRACPRATNLPALPRLSVSTKQQSRRLRVIAARASTLTPPRTRLQGSDDWKDLIRADGITGRGELGKELQEVLIKYAELTQITYDSFYSDAKDTATFGRNRYKPDNLFKKVLLDPNSPLSSYKAVAYFYAESGMVPLRLDPLDLTKKNRYWQGYAAVSQPVNGLRDVVLAWRGTIAGREWSMDAQSAMTDYWPGERKDQVGVAAGFSAMYLEATDKRGSPQAQVGKAMEEIWGTYKDEIGSITVCGHSLGGALAHLCAFDLGDRELNKQPGTERQVPITAYTFCSPRVGDQQFADAFEARDVKVLRTVNFRDIVPKVPGLSKDEMAGKYTNNEPHAAAGSGFGVVHNLDANPEQEKEAALDRAKESFVERARAGLVRFGTRVYRGWETRFRIEKYAEVGRELVFDSENYDKVIKCGGRLKGAAGRAHNLECLMFLINPSRDPALCNKSEDALVEDKGLFDPPIPKAWYTPMLFKGMELKDGKWTLVHEPYEEPKLKVSKAADGADGSQPQARPGALVEA